MKNSILYPYDHEINIFPSSLVSISPVPFTSQNSIQVPKIIWFYIQIPLPFYVDFFWKILPFSLRSHLHSVTCHVEISIRNPGTVHPWLPQFRTHHCVLNIVLVRKKWIKRLQNSEKFRKNLETFFGKSFEKIRKILETLNF